MDSHDQPVSPVSPDAIRGLRKTLGLNQQLMAKRLGISQAQLSRIEAGERNPGGALVTLITEMIAKSDGQESASAITGSGHLVGAVGRISGSDSERPENTLSGASIRRARDFQQAMVCLIENQKDNPIVIAHLGAHALEVGLKGYLMKAGHTEGDVIGLRHNLINVWNEAVASGLEVPRQVPKWVTLLNTLHAPAPEKGRKGRYLARYPHSTEVVLITPNQDVLKKGLESVLSAVEKALGN